MSSTTSGRPLSGTGHVSLLIQGLPDPTQGQRILQARASQSTHKTAGQLVDRMAPRRPRGSQWARQRVRHRRHPVGACERRPPGQADHVGTRKVTGLEGTGFRSGPRSRDPVALGNGILPGHTGDVMTSIERTVPRRLAWSGCVDTRPIDASLLRSISQEFARKVGAGRSRPRQIIGGIRACGGSVTGKAALAQIASLGRRSQKARLSWVRFIRIVDRFPGPSLRG
jgi:hypothetical protein